MLDTGKNQINRFPYKTNFLRDFTDAALDGIFLKRGNGHLVLHFEGFEFLLKSKTRAKC